MPRVKIDYIVSFSSEDSEDQASNLLASEVSKKRWLCARGEPSCSVLLQLPRAVKISAVHIGAYHSALVEVLVGRSETPNEPFQVLVPSSVFLTPAESRRDEPVDRVRSFSGEQLAGAARDARWDRVRVVCSQPYNKHCKYGLSFIHIYEPECKESVAPSSAPALTQPADAEGFRPGALFAAMRRASAEPAAGDSARALAGASTDAQIRQATSHALKNISDSSTRLTKTPITRPSAGRRSPDSERGAERRGERLLYTEEDDSPHHKIDRLISRHREEKSKEMNKKNDNDSDNKEKGDNSRHRYNDDSTRHKYDSSVRKDDSNRHKDDSSRHKDDRSRFKDDSNRSKYDSGRYKDGNSRHKDDNTCHNDDSSRKKDDRAAAKTQESSTKDKGDPSTSNTKRKDSKKRAHDDKRSHNSANALRAGPVSATPHTLLQDVVFALSGYENPRRAAVRDAALAMGARFERDWTPRCTHLICAFPNTPKLKSVRASANGARAGVATAEWVEECCKRRRRLPWQWFATEPKRRVSYSAAELENSPPPSPTPDAECDTDDEIERVLHKQKRQRTDETSRSPTPPRQSTDKAGGTSLNVSSESDVAFVCDERYRGNVTVADSDSDGDVTDEALAQPSPTHLKIDESTALPEFFDGLTFLLAADVEQAFDTRLIRRYVRAYGGLVLEGDSDSEVDYVLCARDAQAARARGPAVRADWVWRCHRERRLCPLAPYELT